MAPARIVSRLHIREGRLQCIGAPRDTAISLKKFRELCEKIFATSFNFTPFTAENVFTCFLIILAKCNLYTGSSTEDQAFLTICSKIYTSTDIFFRSAPVQLQVCELCCRVGKCGDGSILACSHRPPTSSFLKEKHRSERCPAQACLRIPTCICLAPICQLS